ncbi:MAG: transglutaminase domain-containing protein [Clostridia bacterium]|nr:transglutaminase domain-containing protein [Clostridia bacterium]
MKYVLRLMGLLSLLLIVLVAFNILAPSYVPDFLDISSLLPSTSYNQGDRQATGNRDSDGIVAPKDNKGQATNSLIKRDGSQVSEDLLSLKYFRARLNEKDLRIYDTIYQAVEDGIDQLNIKDQGVDKDSLLNIFNLYRMDCPEHYWIDNINIKYQGAGDIVTEIGFIYNSTLDNRDSYDKQIKEIVDRVKSYNIGSSDYDKVKYVHDFIVLNTSYDEGSSHNQNIVSVLINKSSVCAGYARATQYLLNKLGVECLYVQGVSRGEGHAWNKVKVNDAYYNLDSTWDDPMISDSTDRIDFTSYTSYRYFLITDDQLSKTHSQDPPPSFDLPVCNSTSMNYFIKEGLVFNQFDSNAINTIVGKLSDQISRGRRPQFISFKFSNSQAYSSFMEQIANNWYQIASQINNRHGSEIINPNSVSHLSSASDENIADIVIIYR